MKIYIKSIFIAAFLILALSPFASAYHDQDYSYTRYSSERTTGSSHGDNYRKVVDYEKSKVTNYGYDSKETITHYYKRVKEESIPYRSRDYANSCDKYYYRDDCRNHGNKFKYKPVYSSREYHPNYNTYTTDYYYAPLQASSGSYEWRY